MKNLQKIIEREDIHIFVQNLWKTDMFRESHVNEEFVFDVVDAFAYLPRLFCEMSNDHIERAHFSTWWGVITLREDYSNPYIHDLYLLHEMYHAGHMPYIQGIGKAAFEEKMQRNELEASVLSEIQVYFEMPGLREKSFGYAIYADRFLDNLRIKNIWIENKAVAIETLRSIRKNVMVSKPEHLMDETEQWIRRFADQNVAYSITWTDRYNEVETKMAEFQYEAGFNREAAIDDLAEWIEAEAGRDTQDNIPFREEGELFSAFYWDNKRKYELAMKTNLG